MKAKSVFACLSAAMMLLAGLSANAQTVSDKKARRQKDEDVKATVWLNKGGQRVLEGYLRSALVNRPDHIEFSQTPDGERIRYVNEDVDSLLLEGTALSVGRQRWSGFVRNTVAKALTFTLFSPSRLRGQEGTSPSCARYVRGT